MFSKNRRSIKYMSLEKDEIVDEPIGMRKHSKIHFGDFGGSFVEFTLGIAKDCRKFRFRTKSNTKHKNRSYVALKLLHWEIANLTISK